MKFIIYKETLNSKKQAGFEGTTWVWNGMYLHICMKSTAQNNQGKMFSMKGEDIWKSLQKATAFGVHIVSVYIWISLATVYWFHTPDYTAGPGI